MTLSTTTVKNSYSGNGSTTAFTYNFAINSTSELVVIIRSSTGTETVKSITTHYTVADAGAAGGTVTMGSAPASGETLVLIRDTSLTQETDYVANDPFPAETHESALDKLQMQIQEVQEEVDRSIKISRTNTMTSTSFTNDATSRASKVLSFDSAGELSVTNEIGNFRGNWATSTAFVLRDIVIQNSTSDSATYKNVYICTTAHTSTGSYLTQNDTSNWAVLVEVAAFDTLAELGDTNISSLSSGHVLVYDGSDSFDNVAISGDATLAANGALTIASGAVETAMIAADAITGAKIADDAINSEHYTDGSIDTAHIADSQVTTAKIAADAITGAKIADDAINSEHYTDGSIDTAHIADSQVTTAKIAADAVTQAKIADDAVGADQLASDAVVNASIASSAAIADSKLATISTAGKVDIGALEIDGATEMGAALADADLLIVDDGAGGTEKSMLASRIPTYVFSKVSGDATVASNGALTIAAQAVENSMLADDAVGADELAANAVVTASIVDDNVTQAKIADDAVGADQLAANAVVTASIVDDNVTQAKIADDAVGADQLAANAVVNASIASSAAIADSKLATISTADKVSIAALDIDGATELGADIVDADVFIIDDGAGGTNRKVLASRIKSYAASSGATAGFAIAMAICL